MTIFSSGSVTERIGAERTMNGRDYSVEMTGCPKQGESLDEVALTL